ncbi:MAG TPA: DUF6152 family protein [Terriglobia bacterium]|nr:DUF6152 family protein [Terriglobia bacterium]
MKLRMALLAGASIVVCAALLLAHHGTSEYDMNKEVSLSGTVKEWTFMNPHSWLTLTVTPEKGGPEEWSIESAPPSYLTSQGWTVSTLKAGEKLSALVSPKKGEVRKGILLEVKRTSGETLIVRPRGAFGRPAKID